MARLRAVWPPIRNPARRPAPSVRTRARPEAAAPYRDGGALTRLTAVIATG